MTIPYREGAGSGRRKPAVPHPFLPAFLLPQTAAALERLRRRSMSMPAGQTSRQARDLPQPSKTCFRYSFPTRFLSSPPREATSLAAGTADAVPAKTPPG